MLNLDYAERAERAVFREEHFTHAASSEQPERAIRLPRERIVRQ